MLRPERLGAVGCTKAPILSYWKIRARRRYRFGSWVTARILRGAQPRSLRVQFWADRHGRCFDRGRERSYYLVEARGALACTLAPAKTAQKKIIENNCLSHIGDSAPGTLTAGAQLKTLRRAADAPDCTLVYALVPNASLDEAVRARKIATHELGRVAHTMKLEAQGTGDANIEARIEAYIRDVLKERNLWNEP